MLAKRLRTLLIQLKISYIRNSSKIRFRNLKQNKPFLRLNTVLRFMLTVKRVCVTKIVKYIHSGYRVIFRAFVNKANSRKNGKHSFKSFKN